MLTWYIYSATANATFSLFGLCLSDIIDVDMQQHQRRYWPVCLLYWALMMREVLDDINLQLINS